MIFRMSNQNVMKSVQLAGVTTLLLLMLIDVSSTAIADSSLRFRPASSLTRNVFKEQLLESMKEKLTERNLQSCSCKNYTCGCCVHIDIDKEIHMNETACVSVTYLPSDIGVDLKVTLNGVVIIDKEVSARNPPPICAAIPYVHKLASICIKFYDMSISNKHLAGCVALEIRLAEVVKEDFKLGCFRIPPSSDTGVARIVSASSFTRDDFKEKLLESIKEKLTERNLQSCTCKNNTCGCCLHIDIDKEIQIKETSSSRQLTDSVKLSIHACVSVTYLPSDIGVNLKVTINGVVIIDKEVSARNPPPICAAIPDVHKLASICIKFYDMSISNKHLAGCIALEIRLAFVVKEDIKLGCFRIPPSSDTGVARIV